MYENYSTVTKAYFVYLAVALQTTLAFETGYFYSRSWQSPGWKWGIFWAEFIWFCVQVALSIVMFVKSFVMVYIAYKAFQKPITENWPLISSIIVTAYIFPMMGHSFSPSYLVEPGRPYNPTIFPIIIGILAFIAICQYLYMKFVVYPKTTAKLQVSPEVTLQMDQVETRSNEKAESFDDLPTYEMAIESI